MRRGFKDLSRLEQQTLIVGLDDSNHAGERVGEIIAATFSFNPADSKVRNFGTGINYDQFNYWMKDRVNPHDYRFGVLIDEKYRHIHQNIPGVTPELIEHFLRILEFKPSNLELHIDGNVCREDREFLKQAFAESFQGISIHNYIKRQGVHLCPMSVYAAHIIAHEIYSSSRFSEATEHPKLVFVKTG